AVSIVVEDHDGGGKRVVRIEIATPEAALFVARTGQAMPRLQHVHLEVPRVAEKRNSRRHVQSRGGDRYLKARRYFDGRRQGRVEERSVVRTDRVLDGRGNGNGRQHQ